MCGLVGLAGDSTSTWKDIFSNLLIVDSLRGTHSTGAAMVERFKGDVQMAKEVGHPFNLLWSEEYQTMLKQPAKVLIGHNRYATLGKHVVENAHPFAFSNVVGAHNGTIDRAAIRSLHNHEKFETDSEAVFATINEYGIEATIKELTGAWALTWYNKADNTINMLRNDKRPLHYTYSEDCCTLIWASELDMLKMVIDRTFKKPKEPKWYAVPVDTHMSWVVPDSITGKFTKPKTVEIKGKKEEYNYGGYWGVNGWVQSNHNNHTHNYTTSNNVKYINDFKKGKLDTKKFRPPYKDHDGKILNKQRFSDLTANGCVFCGDNNLEWGDFIHPLKAVDNHHAFLCEACYNDDEIYEICENLI